MKCQPTVPERILAFCAAPREVRDSIMQLYDGGGPAQWPKAVADSDIIVCAHTVTPHLQLCIAHVGCLR